MEAAELRLGNWANNGDEDYVINESTMIDILDNWKTDKRCYWQPIMINKDWLKHFKFKPDINVSSGWKISKGRKTLIVRLDDGLVFYLYQHDIGCAYQDLSLDYEYVHELQNLCYILLKIELDTIPEDPKLKISP